MYGGSFGNDYTIVVFENDSNSLVRAVLTASLAKIRMPILLPLGERFAVGNVDHSKDYPSEMTLPHELQMTGFRH